MAAGAPCGTSSPRCCPTARPITPLTRWAATSRGSRTRIIFEKLIQVLRFGCSYASIADCACGATTIRDRRDEWISAGIFADLKTIARESYDRIVGLALEEIAVDGCITKAPGGGMRRPVRRRSVTSSLNASCADGSLIGLSLASAARSMWPTPAAPRFVSAGAARRPGDDRAVLAACRRGAA